MPKRTLRGKRHLRARRIVAVTRLNKQVYKLSRAFKIIERRMPEIARSIIELFNAAYNAVAEINRQAEVK